MTTCELSQNYSPDANANTQLNDIVIKPLVAKSHKCRYCGKDYKHQPTLSRHMKQCCKKPVRPEETAHAFATALHGLMLWANAASSAGTNGSCSLKTPSHSPVPICTMPPVKKADDVTPYQKTLRGNRCEDFYQAILERHLGGAHKTLPLGTTDISTDVLHAEIKVWDCYKEGVGQLITYQLLDPKDELHLYLFGKAYTRNYARLMAQAYAFVNIQLFSLHLDEEGTYVVCKDVLNDQVAWRALANF